MPFLKEGDAIMRVVFPIAILIVISMITFVIGVLISSELVSIGPYHWAGLLLTSLGLSKKWTMIVVIIMWGIGFAIACCLGAISLGFLTKGNAKIWGLYLALLVNAMGVFVGLKTGLPASPTEVVPTDLVLTYLVSVHERGV